MTMNIMTSFILNRIPMFRGVLIINRNMGYNNSENFLMLIHS